MRVTDFAYRLGVTVADVLAACDELGFDATDLSTEVDYTEFSEAVQAAARKRERAAFSRPAAPN